MMEPVRYSFDRSQIEIQEKRNEEDVTFTINVKSEEMRNRVKELRSFFEDNQDLTDAHFYTHQDGRFEVIVRKDTYLLFLLHAFRHRCLEQLAWEPAS